MKKTQTKDAVRNIRKRIVSYLSICLVIMLGLGGVFITRYMGAGINAEAARYYNDHNFKTYELISSVGITEADIEQIKKTEGVIDAEGVLRTSGSLTKGELNFNVELISMTERISVPEVVEGRVPEAKDECMLAEDLAEVKGLKVGDRVKLMMTQEAAAPIEEDSDKGQLLASEFTVTGLMKHPDYFRRKSVDVVALPMAAYNEKIFDDFYSHAFVKTADPEGVDIFSNKYFEKTANTKTRLEDLAAVLEVDSLARAKQRTYDILDRKWQEALDELDGAQKEIDDSEATMDSELAKARKDLEDAQKALDSKVADSEKKIRDGERKIKDSEKKIANAEKKIKAGEKEVKAGEKEIKDGEKKVKDGEAQIKEAKDAIKFADENLPEAKEYLKKLKEGYDKDLIDNLETLAAIRGILDRLKGLPTDSDEFQKVLNELCKYVFEHEKQMNAVRDVARKKEVIDLAQKLKDKTRIDGTKMVDKLGNFNVELLCSTARAIYEHGGDANTFISDVESYVSTIEEALDTIRQYEEYINLYENNRGDLLKQIEDKEKELEKGKKELAAAKEKLAASKAELAAGKEKLAAAKKELAAAKKKLEDSKKQLASEKSKYQAQIRDGWNMYYAQKDTFEQKLNDAKALLAENREEAEAKFAELRAEVENMECKWLVLDRRANEGYVDAKSNIGAIQTASMIFGLLFMLISAIVCFSTLSIIIEEQKKMVGTVKAFGFHKGEILGKYMVFGVSSAVLGSIAGILLGLGLSGVVLRAYYNSGMYQFDPPKSIVTPGATVLASAAMIAICAAATVVACTDILKSPASILMKGGTAKKNAGYRKTAKTSSRRGGSLYSRLILRNMLDDKVRVAISIIIIAFSTFLVGTGISMKLAFDGMTARQVGSVYNYDVRVNLGEDSEPYDLEAVEKILTDAGAEYTLASYTSHVFRLGDRYDALNVLAGESGKLGEFFTINDINTGEAMELPKDGVLAQKRMKESYGFDKGSTLDVLSDDLNDCSADVKGVFDNYVGRLVITSPEGYKTVFGEDAPGNCYLVKLCGADFDKLKDELLAEKDDISFEVASEFVKKFETASLLYNLIVVVTTGIAILMSFMILSNLANIFLNRKKTELTVMRINGFSIRQTKGYLTRETIVTTAAGVVLGVIAGAIGTPFIIKAMEQPDLQFVRTFHVWAWVAAVVLEVLFSIVINSLVFRKVKDLNFRDVA